MAKCTYILRSGKKCPKTGEGNPPLCNKHYNDMLDAEEEDAEDDGPPDGAGFFDPRTMEYVEEVVEIVVEHPKVQGVFNRATSIIDRFANIVDRATTGRRAPDEPPPPNREERRDQRHQRQQQRQQHRPPPPQDDKATQLRDAFMVFGWDGRRTYTEVEVKKRKQELARVYHPDLSSSGSAEMMKRINSAADTLIQNLKR
jgi:hypothetical protein